MCCVFGAPISTSTSMAKPTKAQQVREICLTKIKSKTLRDECKGVDLSGLDLSRADLREANLSRTNLSRANLTNTKLRVSKYNTETIWPRDFDPKAAGAVLVE